MYAAASPRREIVLLPPPPSLCVSLPISRSLGGSSSLRPASCLERAPLHLLARLLAPLPERARQLEAEGGSVRDLPALAPIAPSPLSPASSPAFFQLSPVATGVCLSVCAGFFFPLLLCFCNPEAKAGWGRRGCHKDENIKTLLGLQYIEIPGKAPRLVRARCPARAFRVSERVFRCSRCPPPQSSTALGSEELEQKVLLWVVGDCQWELGRF